MILAKYTTFHVEQSDARLFEWGLFDNAEALDLWKTKKAEELRVRNEEYKGLTISPFMGDVITWDQSAFQYISMNILTGMPLGLFKKVFALSNSF